MFFRRKKPHINFIPKYPELKEYPSIIPASKCLPSWWKKIKINQDVIKLGSCPVSTGTARRCPGITDLLNNGFVMTAWCDITINTSCKGELEYKFSDERFEGELQPNSLFLDHVPDCIRSKYCSIFKLMSPWLIKTSPGYSIMFLDPFYHFNEYFDTSSGILDTDFYHASHQLLLIKKQDAFVIERGTPLSVIIPFKREKIDYNFENYNLDKFNNLLSKTSYISSSKHSPLLSYREEQSKRRKCPFS